MESGWPRFWRCRNINFSIVQFFLLGLGFLFITLPKGGALQWRPPAYLLYSKAYLLGHLYSKAYLFAAEKTSEPEGSTHAAAEARSAGAHRVCSPSLSSLPDLVDLSRVLQGLVLQKIIGRALADVLRSSR